MKKIKVCHFASVHDSKDTRVFVRECVSLANHGFEVYLVAKGMSREEQGVHIIGIGEEPKSRINRAIFFAKKVFDTAIKLDCDIYHFHDPELHRFAGKIKRKGKIVIFDCHEDIPKQILDKYWIPQYMRKIVSVIYSKYQNYMVKKYDTVIAATKSIAESFRGKCKNVVVINNYPKLTDIKLSKKPFYKRDRIIGYAGSLDENRGKNIVIEAMNSIDALFYFASKENISHEKFVNCGQLDRKGVNELYSNSRLGVVLYKPLANHIEAQPMKLFEYMAAGIPVVASNFPLWKEIIERYNCGICIDPENVNEIVQACNLLLTDFKLAEEMGNNGRKAIMKYFNWDTEESKLINLYSSLTDNRSPR